jgi:hypothetical protein
MRIRVIQKPSLGCIDGLRLDYFGVGCQYELGNMLGALMLAEAWAEPVASDEPALIIPIGDVIADSDKSPASQPDPRDAPAHYEGRPAMALDRRRRSRQRSS